MAGPYDLVVIGGGPGGYVAAIRAAQLGMKVACVDKRGALGGTCLNVGCIPSKALLHSSHKFAEATAELARHGVKVGSVALDLATMMARKDEVVKGLTGGVALLLRKNKVESVEGTARIAAPDEVSVTANGAKSATQTLATRRILIATGSDSAKLPGIAIDETRIVSSTGALALAQVPKHLVVIGGGYIGLEMGSVWLRLGAKVTVVEFLDQILPNMDGEVARVMRRALEKQGMVFRTGHKVSSAKANASAVALVVEPAKGGAAETMEADIVLVAVGRVPYADGLGLAELGVERDNRGFIRVNGRFETNVPGIFAIGDVIPGPMLAHKAEDEGAVCAEMMAGQAGHIDYDAIPAVVYTWPEAASVGRTEESLKTDGIAYRVGKFPMTANSRARTTGDTEGLVKLLADAKTDRLIGAHIVAPDAGSMIAELALAMEFSASAEDVARTSHAHPTLAEAVKEAALAVAGRAIHI
jgi:dihydrolipoamide dehydrogenase